MRGQPLQKQGNFVEKIDFDHISDLPSKYPREDLP
jgi:hypothetical protein